MRAICLLIIFTCLMPAWAREKPVPPGPDQVSSLLKNHPALKQVKIVDIHAHTFNAKAIPLEGIVLGKKNMNVISSLVNSRTAQPVARVIAERARLSEPGFAPYDLIDAEEHFSVIVEQVARAEELSHKRLSNHPAVCALTRILGRYESALGSSKIENVAFAPTVQAHQARKQALELAMAQLTEEEHKGLIWGLKLLGFRPEGDAAKGIMAVLLSSDGDIHRWYQTAYPDVDLVVNHLVDFAPVYDQKAGRIGWDPDRRLIDYEGELLKRVARFQAVPDAKSVYFVGYNPFRDHWRGGRAVHGDALRIVQRAITDHGAYGVSLFPLSGYRPACNVIPHPPLSLVSRHPRRQWEARYGGITGEKLDQLLRDLLVWCEENQVPVYAPCAPDEEWEARAGYGEDMAHPQWWAHYLAERSAELGKPSPLRLCLGQAGGRKFWFGRGGEDEWGQGVYALCTNYPNVYCQLGMHPEIADPIKRIGFINRLSLLVEFSHKNEQLYDFGRKLIYGTDWFMPGTTYPAAGYQHSYQVAFLDDRLAAYYAEFFQANAVAFMNIEHRLSDKTLPIAADLRARLRSIQ